MIKSKETSVPSTPLLVTLDSSKVPLRQFDTPAPAISARASVLFSGLRKLVLGDPKVPTLMHVTHAKAGSSWVSNLLKQLFHSRVAPRGQQVAEATGGNLDAHYFESGKIYPAMFMTREQFLAHPELRDINRFVVIRDLRDTVVSLYFSLKISHPLDKNGRKKLERDKLQSLSVEDGLIWLVEEYARRVATIQTSWLNSGETVLQYEDLLQNGEAIFEDLFINKLKLPISKGVLASAMESVGFESRFKRKLGEEDVTSHGRKGIPGDWKNHFTPRVRERFQELYGDVLIATGYERDASWVNT